MAGDGGDTVAVVIAKGVLGSAAEGGKIGAAMPFRLEHILSGGGDRAAENELRDHKERAAGTVFWGLYRRVFRSLESKEARYVFGPAKNTPSGRPGAPPTASALPRAPASGRRVGYCGVVLVRSARQG